jgi:hypothetical protein
MLNVAYAECRKRALRSECRYAECRGAFVNRSYKRNDVIGFHVVCPQNILPTQYKTCRPNPGCINHTLSRPMSVDKTSNLTLCRPNGYRPKDVEPRY